MCEIYKIQSVNMLVNQTMKSLKIYFFFNLYHSFLKEELFFKCYFGMKLQIKVSVFEMIPESSSASNPSNCMFVFAFKP